MRSRATQRLLGDDVFFLTGHRRARAEGRARGAEGQGMTPQAFADRDLRSRSDHLLPHLNISNDDFIRTTEPRHINAAQAIWRRVRDSGFIYKATYEGWYCTVDEAFVPETQLVDGRCPDLRQAGRADQRGELLLPAVGIPAAAARTLRAASRVRDAGHPAQRDRLVRRRPASRT